MIQSLSSKILNYLIKKKAINETAEEKEFYQYGIEITISSLLNILLILLIGLIIDGIIESVIFLICFIIIRQFTGGYHADSYLKCNLTFCMVFIATFLAYTMLYTRFNEYTSILISVTCLSIIAYYCPIEHKNKPIPAKRRKLHKIMSILLSLSYGIVGTTLTVLSNKYGVLILLTLLLVTVLVVAAIVKKGGERNEDEKQNRHCDKGCRK